MTQKGILKFGKERLYKDSKYFKESLIEKRNMILRILLYLVLLYASNAYATANANMNNRFFSYDDDALEIYCSHTRDYRDKRVDPDWVENLYNYGIKSAQDATMDPTNYDMNNNYSPDLATAIVSALGLVAKVGKKTIKPINNDQFSCRSASNQSLDLLIRNKIVIPIALFDGAIIRYSEEISNSSMKKVGDSINFNISTVKSDLDYFGFYIPSKEIYILWKFDKLGNFTKLDDVIPKDSKNPSFLRIKNYID